MNDIKIYKTLTTIQTFEWEVLTEASVDELDSMLNSAKQFIRIGDEIINKNQIKRIFIRTISDKESFILSQTKDIQEKLRSREKEKYSNVWKYFESIQEIQNYINDHLLPKKTDEV